QSSKPRMVVQKWCDSVMSRTLRTRWFTPTVGSAFVTLLTSISLMLVPSLWVLVAPSSQPKFGRPREAQDQWVRRTCCLFTNVASNHKRDKRTFGSITQDLRPASPPDPP